MAIGADIIVRIATDASRAADDVDQAAGKFGKFQSTMQSMVAPATIAVGAIAAFGKAAVDSASATQQAMGALDSVFGASAGKVKQWAAAGAESVGLSESAYGNLASVVGKSMQSMGLSADAAADQTGQLITLGADLAATMGGTTQEAVEALGAALRGESDPAERFGLALKDANVKAKMAADGTDKLTGAAYDAARAQAIVALATEQAAGANGQFAREAGSAAGAQQIASAEWENAKAALGEALLPAVVAVTQALAEFAKWAQENQTLVLVLVGVIGGLAIAVLAVNAALALSSAATAVATAAQWAWNAAMAANPVGLIIVAIAALIAIIVLVVTNWEWFRDQFLAICDIVGKAAESAWNWIVDTVKSAVQGIKDAAGAVFEWFGERWEWLKQTASDVWESIKSVASTVWEAIKGIVVGVWDGIKSTIDSVGSFIIGLWDKLKAAGVACWNAIKSALDFLMTPFNAIKNAIQWVIDKLKTAWDWATKLIGKIPFVGGFLSSDTAAVSASASTPTALSSAGLGARLVRPGVRAGGAPTTVVVNGALDPVAVANQIESILLRQRRRTRGVFV